MSNLMLNNRMATGVTATQTLGSLALILAIVFTSPLAAQSFPRTNVTVSAGVAEYDLSGTGTTGVGAVTASFPILSFLAIDPSLGILRYSPQLSGSDVSFLMPEVSARLQIPGEKVNPYFSLGGGFATVVEGPGRTEMTLTTAIGSYFWLGGAWGVRPEARIRGIDPFVGTTADVTVGLSRRF